MAQSTSALSPGTDQRRQAGDGSVGLGAKLVMLQPDEKADRRRRCRRVGACQANDLVRVQSGQSGHSIGAVVSETFTQLGNLYTQQADYKEMAKEQKVGGGGGDSKTLAGTAFMDASKEAGKSYVRQELPQWVSNYEGQKKVETKVGNTDLASAMTIEPLGSPEGATLRSWA